MKISKLTTHRVAPRWMFLKIETGECLLECGDIEILQPGVIEPSRNVPGSHNPVWRHSDAVLRGVVI